MRHIYLCLQSVKVVILPMSTVFRTVAKCLCLDLNLFFFCRGPEIIPKVTYQRLEGRYDVVFIEIPPLN